MRIATREFSQQLFGRGDGLGLGLGLGLGSAGGADGEQSNAGKRERNIEIIREVGTKAVGL